jgi:hypothetical protein
MRLRPRRPSLVSLLAGEALRLLLCAALAVSVVECRGFCALVFKAMDLGAELGILSNGFQAEKIELGVSSLFTVIPRLTALETDTTTPFDHLCSVVPFWLKVDRLWLLRC